MGSLKKHDNHNKPRKNMVALKGGSYSLAISVIVLAILIADSFTDETADQKEEISITLYLDNDAFPQTTINLYRYDGSTCLATVDGKSIALVPRSQTVDLIEAMNAIVLGKNSTEK